MKYRILRNGVEKYKVQYKWFLFWISLKTHHYDVSFTAIFDTIQEARNAIYQCMENDTKHKLGKQWTFVEQHSSKGSYIHVTV